MSKRTIDRPAWIFSDFDGTLVDSVRMARNVYGAFAAHQGFEPTDEEFSALNGPSLPEIVALLGRRHALRVDLASLLATYRELWRAGLAATDVKTGAAELLSEAQHRAIPLGIVTSGSALFVQSFAAARGWTDRITMVVSGDEVSRSKPDPAVYELALSRARCLASQAVALEDSAHGVAAAVAAGITVVGISDGSAHSARPEELVASGATVVIRVLDQFFAEVLA